MSNDDTEEQTHPPRWLAWAREIAAMAQTGLAYADGRPYDIERYRRLQAIAAEIVAGHSALDERAVLQSLSAQPGYATAKIDVRGAVVERGRVLLVREVTDGRWAMPGGWADVGELPSAMVAREVREESGLQVEPERVIGVYDANRGGELSLYHAYKIVFVCRRTGGEPRPSDETSEVGFFAFDELPPLSLARTNPRHLGDLAAALADPARQPAFD